MIVGAVSCVNKEKNRYNEGEREAQSDLLGVFCEHVDDGFFENVEPQSCNESVGGGDEESGKSPAVGLCDFIGADGFGDQRNAGRPDAVEGEDENI